MIQAMQAQNTEGEVNLVEIWLRKDPVRWVAGAVGGCFAGICALVFAMVLSTLNGMDLWYPAKVPAIPFMGAEAMNVDAGGSVIVIGVVAFLALCVFLGAVFAHFTGTNCLGALLGVGLAWGAFSWVFIFNLFMPAFRDFFITAPSSGAAFFVCMVFGTALTSTAYFDRMFRRNG